MKKNSIVVCIYCGYDGYLDYSDVDERGWVRLYVLEPIIIIDYIDTRNDKKLVIPSSPFEKEGDVVKKLTKIEPERFN